MSVTLTTKFYQASLWKDISKIVFTSPNIDSPAAAGTRSHILPGQGNLGMWFEDTSNMYRISTAQEETQTDYYNYIVTTTEGITKSPPPSTVTVTGTLDNYEIFLEYMKAGVGCSTIGFTPLNMVTEIQEIRVKLEYSTNADSADDLGYLPNLTATGIVTPGDQSLTIYGVAANYDAGDTYNYAWVMPVIGGVTECYFEIDLYVPKKITKIYMAGQYGYDISGLTYLNKRFFGNYTISAKLNPADSWTLLYTGANTTALDTNILLTSNSDFYRYYKITILNNTGLSGFTTTYYALSALQFYTYTYNSTPTRTKPLYSFTADGDADILNISDVSYLGGLGYSLEIDSITVVSGSSPTLASGTALKGWGALSGSIDFKMDDSIVFEVTVGEAYNCRLTAWDDVTHSTTINELIADDHVRVSAVAFCSTNSKLAPNESFDPINHVWGPVHNRILKGNTNVGGYQYYYGDFSLVYRYQADVYGDFLIFKPMLYNIDESITYGVKDYVITLHYSYT